MIFLVSFFFFKIETSSYHGIFQIPNDQFDTFRNHCEIFKQGTLYSGDNVNEPNANTIFPAISDKFLQEKINKVNEEIKSRNPIELGNPKFEGWGTNFLNG
ncbi:hypothetical protein CWI37_0151p0020 [Hamiltosporidium tvaerminnensis]|uniref:Uncharacterized protein n=1 Tax=Hamiltosporidium tvaerminnensis TaxID=1176355 RepID=A0A4Q9LA43_9MICR|nr:hypothetical protein CWI37_0151p0020 [Hamiltosporidium tvaerminnensis]